MDYKNIAAFLIRSDLERQLLLNESEGKFSGRRRFTKKGKEVTPKRKTKGITSKIFYSKKSLLSFLKDAIGCESENQALTIFNKYAGGMKIEHKVEKIFDPSCGRMKVITSYRFVIKDKSFYSKDMNLIPACLLRPFKAFKDTQRFNNRELRLGFNERVLSVYLELKRRIIYHVWLSEKKNDPSLKWEPSLFFSQKTIARELGWTIDQVRYSMKKLKFYFGRDFFREPTKKESDSRKIKGCWNFQINLPPMRKWNAIVAKKIIMYTKNVGDSALKKRFPLETYRYLVYAQRRTKRYDCYAENFMNNSNKEYERLCSLASTIRSYLQEKKEVTADFFKSLIFDKRPLTYRKRVPQPIVRNYYRKLYKAA